MDADKYLELQENLMLVGRLLPNVEDIEGMLEAISHLESISPLVHIMAPIPACNLAPGYDRMRAIASFARAIKKARKEWDALFEVVQDTEARIHRG